MTTGRLDAFKLRDDVIETYADYVTSFIKIADDRVAEKVDEALEAGDLWPEPWVQINPSYKVEATTEDLIRDGTFDEAIRPSFSTAGGDPWRFYTHQVEAFARAVAGRPYVMTTGTGSGKSVTYIGPIIDHVLRTGSGRGIKAIIVYPMNALANSQIDALKEFLPGGYVLDAIDKETGLLEKSKLTAPVTFARYTGQEDRNQRNALIEHPPDILLTNYVMLELLLTRVYDRNLLGNADRLRFVVLDELHTYRGRQGADVAMLLRRVANAAGRLRDAERTNDILYVGTSATMASEGTPAEQRKAVADVASTLFGTTVDPDDVIGETVEAVTDHTVVTDATLTAALGPSWTAPADYAALKVDPVAAWTELQIGVAPDAEGTLRRAEPKTLTGLAAALAGITGQPEEVCERVVQEVITAGDRLGEARARRDAALASLRQARASADDAARLHEAAREELLLEATANVLEGVADRYLSERIEPLTRDIAHRWKLVFGTEGLELDPAGEITLRRGDVGLALADMSGGETAVAGIIVRLLVAAAATRIPSVWFDEPLEHLDPRRRAAVAQVLVQAAATRTVDQIVVTTYEEGIAHRLALAAPDLVTVIYADADTTDVSDTSPR